MTRKFYIETHGCQMNVHDSEKAASVLRGLGYEPSSEPHSADLVVLNTCMVREKAARKVYSRISEIKRRTREATNQKRDRLFAVMGCVAQAEAGRIFDKCSDVRLVLGTQAIGSFPSLLEQVDKGFPRAIDVRLSKHADFLDISPAERTRPYVAFITITEGCNKFCSFCIVPFTRGRERSRSPQMIVDEARGLRQAGYREVHLLGQNVNSYGLSGKHGDSEVGNGTERGNDEITFAELLARVARESGIERIKYTTSYPRDFTRDIVKVMDEHPNLCEWVHLPAQSGSDRILRAMRRGYSRKDYSERIDWIKSARKDISITGDIIVGFPGETDDDFNQTLNMVAEVGYDSLYIFKYSPRPHTPAASFTDSVPEEKKTERFLKLDELQSRIQRERYGRLVGREVEVLVEGLSSRSALDHTGHTRCNKVINFPKGDSKMGEIIRVEVKEVRAHSLYGNIV
jgi:tRNA-2-methylthio-N6-dimethylallyladenosine synthase